MKDYIFVVTAIGPTGHRRRMVKVNWKQDCRMKSAKEGICLFLQQKQIKMSNFLCKTVNCFVIPYLL